MQKCYALICLLLLSFLLRTSAVCAQEAPSPLETEKLATLCKVWGYYKYFHPNLVHCQAADWDQVLIEAIELVRRIPSEEAFEQALFDLRFHAGEVPTPATPPDDLSDYLTDRLDLDWIETIDVPAAIRQQLQAIRTAYRARAHCQVTSLGTAGEALDFAGEAPFANMLGPNEAYRLLALFRFWNAINYFYPYVDALETDWHTALENQIPRMVAAEGSIAYRQAVVALVDAMQDSHAEILDPVMEAHLGVYYAPFLVDYLQGKTVVRRVLDPSAGVKVGDELVAMDGVPIDARRAALRAWAWGGNEARREHKIDQWLIKGPKGPFEVILKRADEELSLRLSRDWDDFAFTQSLPREYQLSSRLPGDIGYLQLEHLQARRASNILYSLLRRKPEIKGVILDLRFAQHEYFDDLAGYFLDQPTDFALRALPDPEFPGLFKGPRIQQTETRLQYATPALYLLMDETTVGRGELTAMSLEPYADVTKIGSPTAGSVANTASQIRLPGGIRVLFNATYYEYPEGTALHTRGIQPDRLVEPTPTALQQGRDLLVEAALHAANEVVEQPRVIVYPSPASEEVNLLVSPNPTGTVDVQILDVQGRVVRAFQETPAFATLRMDVSSLQQGHYLVRVNSAGAVHLSKFIKR